MKNLIDQKFKESQTALSVILALKEFEGKVLDIEGLSDELKVRIIKLIQHSYIYRLRQLHINHFQIEGYDILMSGWIPVDQVPDWYSFRCLIKFREFGLDGPDKNHISTGWWSHPDKEFSIDDDELKDLTPEYFIPIYEEGLIQDSKKLKEKEE